ncbi:hypothetical protein QBC38DRAFT_452774 [Podospora fimiseda]|uniref:Uncharacterized protein n=1 Tax=Podospora fimiseda TaxID=252190 RepID=A0AAN7BV06_9PEZI|nr:hypothetical protein QBC38DRAFT_452774 [Podospora fimiseda]
MDIGRYDSLTHVCNSAVLLKVGMASHLAMTGYTAVLIRRFGGTRFCDNPRPQHLNGQSRRRVIGQSPLVPSTSSQISPTSGYC